MNGITPVHTRTSVYNITYHIVWAVKRRRKVLTPEVEAYMRTVIQDIADSKGFTVSFFEVSESDHVELFASAPPKLSPSILIQYLKGITGRKLYEHFPDLKDKLWKGELWNHSTYIETVGTVTEDAVRDFIEHQAKQY